ncbi:hypothetical protein J2Z22_004783 [Paenibacillus forsythiae]|uniref:Uncharacterized protein n=1 Tax=Paenibacillus forsythiae TaxID=365616 RepID=A0ABU3HEH7_9BACL|nr:hypothetical protein [Paenibacillus forsythiae]MDT3429183.1 hypothetical protein [Paenibacillus forsythiae]
MIKMISAEDKIKVQSIREVLSELGFKGSMLRDLRDIIVDEEILYAFYNFILKNEDEVEEGITSLLLVYKFKKHMQDKQSFADYHEFIEAYNSIHEVFEKKKVLERLFCSESNDLTKIIHWLNADKISHKKLYQLAVEYRSQYSVRESLFLIETLHM